MKARFPIPTLVIRIRQRSIFSLASEWRSATGVDFNRYGVGFVCTVPYRIGNRLYLNFRGPYISLDNVAAQVVHVECKDEGFRIGVVFLYWQQEEHYDLAFDNALARIERIYHDQYHSGVSA